MVVVISVIMMHERRNALGGRPLHLYLIDKIVRLLTYRSADEHRLNIFG
jgi:hypothetical protein